MAQNLNTPQALSQPFAQNGIRPASLPNLATGTNRASLQEGYPEKTMIPVSEGGIPPSGADENALGYLYTSFMFFLQNGGVPGYRPEVADAIGGYPLNARLWGVDSNGNGFLVRSTIANNRVNFTADPSQIGEGKPWVYDIVTRGYVDSTFAKTDLSNVTVTAMPRDYNTVNSPDYIVRYANFPNYANINNSILHLNYRLWKSNYIELRGILSNNMTDNKEMSFNSPINIGTLYGATCSCDTASNGTDSDSGYAGIGVDIFSTYTLIKIRLGRSSSRTTVNSIYFSVFGYAL